jgi:hypothetical protein
MSLKQQKLGRLSSWTISEDRLLKKMSEVISLREKVAQAELAKLDIRNAKLDIRNAVSDERPRHGEGPSVKRLLL